VKLEEKLKEVLKKTKNEKTRQHVKKRFDNEIALYKSQIKNIEDKSDLEGNIYIKMVQEMK